MTIHINAIGGIDNKKPVVFDADGNEVVAEEKEEVKEEIVAEVEEKVEEKPATKKRSTSKSSKK